MLRSVLIFLVLFTFFACGVNVRDPYNQARKGFKTHLIDSELRDDEEPETPPEFIQLVQYPSELGLMNAYLVVPDPESKAGRPAVIWISGGFGNGIGSTVWQPQDPQNDQSASAFWKKGIITFYPALRGGSGNPGRQEQFLGEVDDVISAAEYLADRPEVDPQRIYLGGHSTGGTLVLLVAASTDRFRAVLAYGPVSDVRGYGERRLNFYPTNNSEWHLRSPGFWLKDIHARTWIMEGAEQSSNIDELRILEKCEHGPMVGFKPYPGRDHFSVLALSTSQMAEKILKDSETYAAFDPRNF